jgi:hypothetical protein
MSTGTKVSSPRLMLDSVPPGRPDSGQLPDSLVAGVCDPGEGRPGLTAAGYKIRL